MTHPSLQDVARGVIETNDDAQQSKLSCAQAGYIRDDFVHFFVRNPRKRPPLINRGSFTRFVTLRSLLVDFLKRTSTVKSASLAPQVIVMGAGYDATYFQLAVDHPDLIQRVKYVELDLPEVTFNKLRVIKTNPMLANLAGIPETARNECNTPMFCSDTFSIHPADLRRLHDVDHALKAAQVLGNAPTLILLECVAVYMEHHEGNALLKWVADKFTMDAAIAIYEQYNPNDAFGKQMMLNLSIRGCPLRGILPSLSDHVQRLKSAGWHQAVAHSMNDVWKLYIHPLEKRRVQQLEFLDELEEWELLQSHYCIVVATKSEESTDLFKNYLDFPNLGFS